MPRLRKPAPTWNLLIREDLCLVPRAAPPPLDLQPLALTPVQQKLEAVHGPLGSARQKLTLAHGRLDPVQQKLGAERGRLDPVHERRGGARRNLGGEFLLHDPARPVHDPEFLPHRVVCERLEPVRETLDWRRRGRYPPRLAVDPSGRSSAW